MKKSRKLFLLLTAISLSLSLVMMGCSKDSSTDTASESLSAVEDVDIISDFDVYSKLLEEQNSINPIPNGELVDSALYSQLTAAQDWILDGTSVESYLQSREGYSITLVSEKTADELMTEYRTVATNKSFGDWAQQQSGQYTAQGSASEVLGFAIEPIEGEHYLVTSPYNGQNWISIVVQDGNTPAPSKDQISSTLQPYLPDSIVSFFSASLSGARDGATFLSSQTVNELKSYFDKAFANDSIDYIIDQDIDLTYESGDQSWTYALLDESTGNTYNITVYTLIDASMQQMFPNEDTTNVKTYVTMNFTKPVAQEIN